MNVSTMMRVACMGALTAGVSAGVSACADARPKGQATVPIATIIEDLRLKADAENFGNVSWFQVGPRGQIVAPDYSDLTYLVYDSTGKRLGSLGRRGTGPGEWPSINNFGWKGDTIYVSVPSMRRVSYYLPDGTHLRTVANPSGDELRMRGMDRAKVLSIQVSHVLADGRLGAIVRYVPAGSAVPKDSIVRVFATVSQNGEVQSLAELPRNVGDDQRYFIRFEGEEVQVPFVALPERWHNDSFQLMARMTQMQTSPTEGAITVTLMKTTGDTIYTREIFYNGEPIPDAVRDSAIAATVESFGADSRSRLVTLLREKTPSLYTGSPHMVLGMDGTAWVSLRPGNAGHSYKVLNSKGEIVSTVTLPENARIFQATSGNIWAIQTTDNGLSDIVRYRVSGIP